MKPSYVMTTELVKIAFIFSIKIKFSVQVFFQLTFGVNSSIQELGDVMTKVPPGATRDGNLSRNWYGLGRRQTKFAARTQPNCPKSVGKLQASP